MIISASRRTDIPAFYSEWLMNRIRAGFLLTRNPFNYHQVSRVSLLPEDVDAIVFWTRNPTKLLPHLDELTELGHRFYFQFTITGYPRALETKTLNPHKALDVFKQLSAKMGAEKVIWRYDPILFSNLLPFDEHLRLFSKLARELEGHTHRVVISFADFYQKTEKNLKTVDTLVYSDITHNHELCLSLSQKMSDIARQHGLEIYSCAEDVDLAAQGIQHGKCIDEALINNLFGLLLANNKDPGQREACGCVKSIDIGAYNTCLHGCKYCYATFNHNQANTNFKKHDPLSPFLLGNADGVDPNLLRPVIFQQNLF
jgi:DNA repair photolyase